MAPAGFFKRSNQTNKSVKEDDNIDRRRAMIVCCQKATKFTFSNLGLCVVVALYAVAGTFMFMHVEQTNEKELCIQAMNVYYPMENSTANKLWEISSSFRSPDDEELILAAFQKQIQQFGDNVRALNYDGSNCTLMGEINGPDYHWNLPGALLFSITVFTTIGYGNITPKTTWGRLICIAYALVGIPLMLLCLANLGEVMADIFRFVYSRVCCCGCFRNRNKDRASSQNLKQTDAQNSSPESWKSRYDAQKTAAASDSNLVEDDDEDDDEDEKVSVPLTVTMAVIGGYIFMGSLLFGVWEGWDWLTSAYYCFITISTIGFGDVVPGTSGFQTSSDGWKMVAAAGYIIFGMAIMSMAFNLIQEEIVAKFVWLGQKLGIVEKPKEDVIDEEDSKKPQLQSSLPVASAPRPVSSIPPATPFATQPPPTAAFFPGAHKQPASYHGPAPTTGSDSPLTKRTAAAMESASHKNN